MKNHIQPGKTLTVPAPYAVASGDLVVAGALFGVASNPAAIGAPVEVALGEVYEFAKAGTQTWTVGQVVYWDATNKVMTTTTASNLKVGVASEAAVSAATVGRVRLNGSF